MEFEIAIDLEIEKELKREEKKQKMKELKANKTTAVEVHRQGLHLKDDFAKSTQEDDLLLQTQNAEKIDKALPEVDQGVLLEDLEEEDEVTLHSSRPLSSNADEIDGGSLMTMDEETSATESEEHQCNNTASSPDIRSPSPANSIISSASSTYLEPNMVSCGASSTSDAASISSTPTPMTSELDHKVNCLWPDLLAN